MIALSFDLEWSPEPVIRDLLSLLHKAEVKATFFVTHDSESLRSESNNELFEFAIHPNFSDLSTGEQTLKDILEIVPQAKGARAHSCLNSFHLVDLYARSGLLYVSDYYLHLQPRISVLPSLSGIVHLPIYFMDNIYLEINSTDSRLFELESLGLEKNGLKIFDFHPIHIYLNTRSLTVYESAKRCMYVHPD